MGVDANYFYQDYVEEHTEGFTPSLQEREMILTYRNLDYYGKRHVEAVIEIEKSRLTDSEMVHEAKLVQHEENMEALDNIKGLENEGYNA